VTYVDSSALVPLYVPGALFRLRSPVAQDVKQLPFTALHQLEVPNAFELLVGRGLITRDECRAILQ
jgi:predicted nucleic acid-binding protein